MAQKNSDVPEQFSAGWLEQLDGRYSLARQLRQRYDTICNDLGGKPALSYMAKSLIERGIWLETWLAQQEAEFAKGKDFDVSRWIQAANSLQGIYSRLGLERRAKDVPSLGDYLRQRGSGEASAA